MSFTVNGQRVFAINYKEIALSNAPSKNEVVLEFQQVGEDGMSKKNDKSDILTEMRFYVPNTELEMLEE
jgi:hypothetical protein